MLIKNTRCRPDWNLPEAETISEAAYFKRRTLLKGILGASALSALPVWAEKQSPYSTDETQTSEYSVTHYNNFYEFSTSKSEPARLAKGFKTTPDDLTYSDTESGLDLMRVVESRIDACHLERDSDARREPQPARLGHFGTPHTHERLSHPLHFLRHLQIWFAAPEAFA